jgi:DNA-binding beta-propeller fold protein YncE
LLCAARGTAEDRLVLVAGGGAGGDGSPAVRARLTAPFGVDFDRQGNLFLVEMTGHRVRKVDTRGALLTVAGTGKPGDSGDGAAARDASFNGMHSLAIAPDGTVLVADTWNNRVRRLDLESGRVDSAIGSGTKGFAGDGGPAVKARFGGIYCIAFDPKQEHLYLADLDNRRIRGVDVRTGVVTTVAGDGRKGVPEDGSEARTSPLVDPRAVAADAAGNVYILERGGHALRVVDASGRIRTLVGTGQPGNSGDDGPGRQATLRGPKHLCIDLAGDVLLADTDNHRIRKYRVREGTIVAVVGTGKKGSAGLDGPPLRAALSEPHGVYVHHSGTIYIADSGNDRVVKIEH